MAPLSISGPTVGSAGAAGLVARLARGGVCRSAAATWRRQAHVVGLHSHIYVLLFFSSLGGRCRNPGAPAKAQPPSRTTTSPPRPSRRASTGIFCQHLPGARRPPQREGLAGRRMCSGWAWRRGCAMLDACLWALPFLLCCLGAGGAPAVARGGRWQPHPVHLPAPPPRQPSSSPPSSFFSFFFFQISWWM